MYESETIRSQSFIIVIGISEIIDHSMKVNKIMHMQQGIPLLLAFAIHTV